MSTLNNRVLIAAVWSVGLRLFIKALALINTVVLARLLAPEDFGLIAIVMSVFALIDIFQSFGFDVVLIQKQKASNTVYNTAWTIQVLFGLLTGTIMFFMAPFIASFYADPRLEVIAQITAVFFIVQGFKNIGVVNFRKELDFKKEFAFQSSIKIFSVAITIGLALYFRSYWALIISMLATRFFELGFSYYMSKYRPRFTLLEWREIIGFSSWLFLNSFVQFFNRNTANLTIGKMVGVSGSGIYTFSNEFSELPSGTLVAAVNRATFPGYSKVSHDPKALRALYLQVLAGIAGIGIPASVFVSLVAHIFVPVLLGDKWLEAIPIIQVMGLAYALVSVNTNVNYIFHAVGKPHVPTITNTIRAIILLCALAVLIPQHGVIGAAYALLILVLIMFPVYFVLLKRVMPMTLLDYLKPLLNPVVGTLAMFGFMQYAIPALEESRGEPFELSLVYFVLLSIVLGIVYFLTVFAMWVMRGRNEGPEQFVIEKISERLTRPNKPAA